MTDLSPLNPDVVPPRALIEAVVGMSTPVVLAHVVPDADAIGSMTALARAMTAGGTHAVVSLPPESVSQRLQFLVDRAQVQAAGRGHFEQADGFITLDTAKIVRCNIEPSIKQGTWRADRPLVNIDHHATNEEFGALNWIVPQAASTAELVYYVIRAAGWSIDRITAGLLYAGIQTDTLGFSLPTVCAATLQVASELVAHGADVGTLGERLCRSQRKSEFDLLRVIYANTTVTAHGQIAYSHASHDEVQRTGCTAADIDDQISVPRSLEAARLALLFTEGNPGKIRINFRGEGDVTVVELAAEFNGGGHAQAAGAVVDGSLHEVMDRVLRRAEAHLERFEPSSRGPD